MTVMDKLKCRWNPEQISGRMQALKLPFRDCHETIYQYVYRHANKHIFAMQRNKLIPQKAKIKAFISRTKKYYDAAYRG